MAKFVGLAYDGCPPNFWRPLVRLGLAIGFLDPGLSARLPETNAASYGLADHYLYSLSLYRPSPTKPNPKTTAAAAAAEREATSAPIFLLFGSDGASGRHWVRAQGGSLCSWAASGHQDWGSSSTNELPICIKDRASVLHYQGF